MTKSRTFLNTANKLGGPYALPPSQPSHLVQLVLLARAAMHQLAKLAVPNYCSCNHLKAAHQPTWYSECSWPGRSRPTYTISWDFCSG